MNNKGKTTFQFLSPNGGGWSFNTYRDVDYNEQLIQIGVDRYQRPVAKRFAFKAGQTSLTISNTAKDINGRTWLQHFKESPFCQGSPLCPDPKRAVFKEINIAKDAEVFMDTERLQFQAKEIVFKCSDEQLQKLANLTSCFSGDKMVQQRAVLGFAQNNPEGLIEAYNGDDLEVKSLIKRYIAEGILIREGSLIKWRTEGRGKNLVVGVSEDEAIAKLMKDDKLLEGLKKHSSDKKREAALK